MANRKLNEHQTTRNIHTQRALKAACSIAAACLLHAGIAPAADPAADYPAKPVRLLVAQGTGSSVDNLGRILAGRLTELWGKQVIVDNRGGAGGTIGAEIASHAAPDGYTLLVSSTAMQVVSPQIYTHLSYHPTKDFVQFTMTALTQNILVANPSMPFKSVRELIAYAKANPGKLNMANAGSGFQSHLAGVLFAHMANIDVHHIPYKGGTSIINVIAGESQITIVPGPSVMGHIRSGRVRALGVGGEKRSSLLPDVPTISESGVPGFVSTGWTGMMGPKGIPKPIAKKIYDSLIKVMNDPTTREMFTRQGAEPMTSTPEEMLTFINAEYGRFTQAIKLAGLKIQ